MARGDVSFGLVESNREVRDFGKFIDKNVGDYNQPHHVHWNHETNLPAISAGERPGFAFWQRESLEGGMVLKPLDPGIIELKYFRNASPDFQGRGAAGFMMRQIPFLGQQALVERSLLPDGATEFTMQLDTRADSPAQSFFGRFGFEVVGVAVPLYDDILDVVMQRTYPLR